ncbi:MAG: LAGLIDADG family homing endonuclease [Candidatus Paceibacterota bacterium]
MNKSFKQTCIDLRLKDCTLNEIVKLTRRSKTSVYFHIKHLQLSEEKKKTIARESSVRAALLAGKRKGVALRPFKKFIIWSPDLVLLVAHFMFDGRLAKSCEYNNRSLALIRRVETLMKLVYDFSPTRYLNIDTGVMRTSYHNVAMANFFKLKAEDLLNEVANLPLDCQKEFIRAFFDDEGSMDFRLNRNKRRVRGYQDDKKVLSLIKELLSNFAIEATEQGRNEVVISGKENLIKFREEINFSKGVRINPNRTNSLWKKNLEKRKLLDMAIDSFKK